MQGWRQAGMHATMTFAVPGWRPATLITTFLGMSTPKEGTSTAAPAAAAVPAIPYFTDASWSVYKLKIDLLTSGVLSDMAKSSALQSNLDVDYVITYRFANTGMPASRIRRAKQ